jgi:diadenosine tetraphosphate (Ap4A) HIT family hydrolase
MIYKNEYIQIEIEESEIPWLKIFSVIEYKEFSQCDKTTRLHILEALDIIEKEMIEYFKPTKINIASFGNYVPHVHFHIMARFESDSFYPEPMWGKKQKDGNLSFPSFEKFCEKISVILNNKLNSKI